MSPSFVTSLPIRGRFAVAALLLCACVDRPAPVAPLPPRAHGVIVDGAHGNGRPQFYFLPPLVAQPTTAGQADPSLTPVVQVCAMSGPQCDYTVAEFTTTAGPGSAVVQYEAGAQQYHVNWATDRCSWGSCTLDPAVAYRLHVFVQGLLMGYADLAVVANAGAAKNLQTQETIPLIDGRTLPIRFRIETGIAASVSVSPDPVTVSRGGTTQMTATVRDLHGDVIPGAPVLWSVDAPIATLNSSGLLTGVSSGCSIVRARHAELEGTASVRVTPLDPDIAYYNRVSGHNWRVFTQRVDGCTPPAQLTNTPIHGPQFGEHAAVSRDGQLVAFRGEDNLLHVARVDGSEDRVIPNAGFHFGSATWSPDGTELAFVSYVGSGHSEVFAIGVDGSNLRRVSVNPVPGPGAGYSSYSSNVYQVRWSPVDDRIAYTRWVATTTGLVNEYRVYVQVVNADGANPVVLASAAGSPHMLTPEWSPDGARIAYVRADDNSLWTVNPDGTGAVQLVGPLGDQRSGVSWSPDGQDIAYTDNAVPGSGLFVISALGGPPVLLASPVYPFNTPAWVRDGSEVVYTYATAAGWFLYSVARAGGSTRNLGPGWAPVTIP